MKDVPDTSYTFRDLNLATTDAWLYAARHAPWFGDGMWTDVWARANAVAHEKATRERSETAFARAMHDAWTTVSGVIRTHARAVAEADSPELVLFLAKHARPATLAALDALAKESKESKR